MCPSTGIQYTCMPAAGVVIPISVLTIIANLYENCTVAVLASPFQLALLMTFPCLTLIMVVFMCACRQSAGNHSCHYWSAGVHCFSSDGSGWRQLTTSSTSQSRHTALNISASCSTAGSVVNVHSTQFSLK